MNKFQKLLEKKHKLKIVCLTAYSKNIASILDNHCDIILVLFFTILNQLEVLP